MKNLSYPKSFPNPREQSFLKMIQANDIDFPRLWNQWKTDYDFEKTETPMVHLLPLVYLRMEKLGMQHDNLFSRIKGIYKNAWIRNQRLIFILKEIISECTIHHIPVITLKGIPMIIDIYRDSGARFLGDADIMVPPEYAPQLYKILLEKNWTCDATWAPIDGTPSPTVYQVVKSTTFTSPYGISLDVHWNMFPLNHHATTWDILRLKTISSIAFRNACWERSTSFVLDDVACKQLCREDLLIHVMIHGTGGDPLKTLRWVTDACAIINHFPIDWNMIIDRSKQFHLTMELRVGFRYLVQEFTNAIPQWFLERLENLPVTNHEIKDYYRFANIVHTSRYSMFGNFPMFWYGYWKLEPGPKNITGLFRYIKNAFGVTSIWELFLFIFKKYQARLMSWKNSQK